MELADRQRLDERSAHLWRHDELAVGFAMVGGQLGEKLVVRNAGRRGQAGLVEDAGADFRSAAAPCRSCG
jgi:hypothetical protein